MESSISQAAVIEAARASFRIAVNDAGVLGHDIYITIIDGVLMGSVRMGPAPAPLIPNETLMMKIEAGDWACGHNDFNRNDEANKKKWAIENLEEHFGIINIKSLHAYLIKPHEPRADTMVIRRLERGK